MSCNTAAACEAAPECLFARVILYDEAWAGFSLRVMSLEGAVVD